MIDPSSSLSKSQDTSAPPHRKRNSYIWLILLILPAIVFASVWIFNDISVNKPLQKVLASDPRNAAIKAHVRYQGWTNPRVIVFDIESVSPKASRLDVLRTFLQYAQAMKAERFRTVILACRGSNKFQMEGRYFNELGVNYETENPMYTIRTLPINVTAMDGSHPFDEYEGGILAVLSKELEQFADFSDRWYGRDLALAPEER